MKLALACGIFEERLHRARAPDSHDDFIGVDVLKGLHGNVVSGSLWKIKKVSKNKIVFVGWYRNILLTQEMNCTQLCQQLINCFYDIGFQGGEMLSEILLAESSWS